MEENNDIMFVITYIAFNLVIVLGLMATYVPCTNFNLVDQLYILFIFDIVLIFIKERYD